MDQTCRTFHQKCKMKNKSESNAELVNSPILAVMMFCCFLIGLSADETTNFFINGKV